MLPNRLHLVWIGPRPFPHAAHLEAWQRMHPGWNVTFWTETLLDAEDLSTQPIVDQIGHIAGKVNLIRLELLARYGGVYVDADTQPLKSLDTLGVPDWADSWAMTTRSDFVHNAIIASTPHHPIMVSLVNEAAAYWHSLQGQRVVFTKVFGSLYINDPLRAHPGFWEPDRGRRWGTRQVFRDRQEGPAGDAWVLHNCDRSWRRELGGSRVQL